MTGEIEVFVEIGGQAAPVGKLFSLRRRNLESATFLYYPSYLSRPDAYAIDPALPLTSGAIHTAARISLFGAFTDSCPDRWGRTLISRAEVLRAKAAGSAPRSFGEIDLLLRVRDDLRQGALRFRDESSPDFQSNDSTGVPVLADLSELLDIANRAEGDSAAYEDLARLVRAGSSLGGARPKAHVLTDDGRLAIAKFPSSGSDTWNVMAWEKVALDIARAAGIDVPDSLLLRVAGRSVLIINRFDRSGQNRFGYLSAMTMLEARDGDTRSYLDLAEVIEQSSPSATADLSQLWRRIALNVLISNTDDHLRNHGFLHTSGDSWRLSPAFDLNPNPQPGQKYLSTAIDRTDSRASINTLLSVRTEFRLTLEAAVTILSEVAYFVSTWRAVATRIGLGKQELESMKSAFEHDEFKEACRITSR